MWWWSIFCPACSTQEAEGQRQEWASRGPRGSRSENGRALRALHTKGAGEMAALLQKLNEEKSATVHWAGTHQAGSALGAEDRTMRTLAFPMENTLGCLILALLPASLIRFIR